MISLDGNGDSSSTLTVVHRRNNDNFQLVIDPKAYIPRSPLSFNTKVAEKLFDEHFRIRLSEISLGENVHFIDKCKSMVKRYSSGDSFSRCDFSELRNECFGGIIPPSATLYKDKTEFHYSIMLMYQISYAHYVLGKSFKMNGQFPNWCCGLSASNLLSALWEAGIVSAIKVCDDPHDHCYNIVPFILGNKSGVIIIDPTSDQLIKYRSKEVRNKIMIATEKRWSYITDYKNGADLYPTEVNISTAYGRTDVNYSEYIDEALKKPVVVV